MEIKVIFCAALLANALAADVQWTRTAQNTEDRLTPQPPLQYGTDFDFNVSIVINR